jgi:hypothetical protein
MPLSIRRLGPGDEAVLELLAREAPEFDLAGRTSPEQALSAAEAADYLADPAVLHWVADEDGRVLGELLCHFLRLPSEAGRELLLYSSAFARASADTASAGRSCRRCSAG